eukprot:4537430-Prymnesium_polylepis.1
MCIRDRCEAVGVWLRGGGRAIRGVCALRRVGCRSQWPCRCAHVFELRRPTPLTVALFSRRGHSRAACRATTPRSRSTLLVGRPASATSDRSTAASSTTCGSGRSARC